MTEAIKVEGLKEFGRDLKKLDRDLPKLVRVALNTSAELVAAGTRPKVDRATGRAAGTVRPKSTRTKARVAGGGRRAPYYPWLDFGGRVGRGGAIRRPFTKDGRYLYPTYRKLRDSGEFQEVMTRELVDVARKAGIEVDT